MLILKRTIAANANGLLTNTNMALSKYIMMTILV